MITELKSKTLQAVHLLRQVNFSEAQAEVIADLIEQKIEISEEKREKNLELLSTKGDVTDVKKDILVVEKKLELKIEQVRSELSVKIEQVKSDLIRWVSGAMIAQTGILFTLIKLFA